MKRAFLIATLPLIVAIIGCKPPGSTDDITTTNSIYSEPQAMPNNPAPGTMPGVNTQTNVAPVM